MGELVTDAKVLKSTSKPTSGTGYVYNIQVNTEENGDEWFGCGFEDPQLTVGDIIEFEITQVGDYVNVDIDTLVVLEAAPKREKSSRSSSRGGGRSNSRSSGRDGGHKPSRSAGRGSPTRKSSPTKTRGKQATPKAEVDWDKKDKYIRLQSCQNTAIATIRGAIESGAVALPAKKGDKFDAYQALIEDEAARLINKYDDIINDVYDQGEEYDSEVPE